MFLYASLSAYNYQLYFILNFLNYLEFTFILSNICGGPGIEEMAASGESFLNNLNTHLLLALSPGCHLSSRVFLPAEFYMYLIRLHCMKCMDTASIKMLPLKYLWFSITLVHTSLNFQILSAAVAFLCNAAVTFLLVEIFQNQCCSN